MKSPMSSYTTNIEAEMTYILASTQIAIYEGSREHMHIGTDSR